MTSDSSFCLVLPNIRSCHIVGAFFRTADACGVDRLYLVGYTAHPPKVQIDKVALGAETWMPWEARESLLPLITELKQTGHTVIGLEKTPSSTDIMQWKPAADIDPHRIALIVGNEVTGIEQEALDACDVVLHIAMRGKKDSLNVSIAGGIALHTLATRYM